MPDDPLTEKEVERAVKKLKKRKRITVWYLLRRWK